MKKIILAGNSVTAEIIYTYVIRDPRYLVVGAVVDDDYKLNGTLSDTQSIGISELSEFLDPSSYSIIMAMGYDDLNRSRQGLYGRLKDLGCNIEAYVHPDARVYSLQPIGEGSVILPGCVIEPHATVGSNSMVWCNTTIAHHSHVGDNCWIASGSVISGQAHICNNVFMGVNATVVNKVRVEEFCIIGANALISKNTKPSSVHLARSAEPLRYSSSEYVKFFGN